MLISKAVYSNEGNSVANYTEYVFRCERCAGEGWYIEKDKEEVACPKCEGAGEYTVRR